MVFMQDSGKVIKMKISGKRQILSLAAICAVVVMVAMSVRAQSGASGLYKSKCQACHGPDGSGDTVMGKKLVLVTCVPRKCRNKPMHN